ncbi:Uncharacterized protein YpmB [Lentibacillus halodurans]|uniref:Uncharacterized protein YpmB n=2 Tax=Lentibacillus halodurans TaxID=237679 RepID=A0A1I0VDX6_9BACI|nr:Uncharacterized protein YpmB [Lentibacillus halodurans]
MPGWLKWILGIIGLLLLVFLVFGIYLYYTVQENRTGSFEQIEKQVLAETELTAINKIERFHGEKAYYTVYGQTDNAEAKIVFYPFDQNQSNIISLNQSEMIAKKKIRANWNSQCQSCTLIDITPAIMSEDEERPAWELTYEDNTGRYVLEYLSVSDGSRIEVLRFNRLYNEERD